jgi:hypothetical protein
VRHKMQISQLRIMKGMHDVLNAVLYCPLFLWSKISK